MRFLRWLKSLFSSPANDLLEIDRLINETKAEREKFDKKMNALKQRDPFIYR